MKAEQFTAEIADEIRKVKLNGVANNVSIPANPARDWLIPMSDIQKVPTSWLWRNRIPIGRMTLMGGDPGAGKTYTALAIAAAESRGEALPGGDKPEGPSNVLLLSLEDGLEDTFKERLDLLNADQQRIVTIDPKKNFSVNKINAGTLEQMVKYVGPSLVVLDPLTAFAAGRKMNEGTQMRQLLTPLVALASKYSFALLVVLHLNKGNGKAIYKFQESIDIVAQARSAFIIANDANDKFKHVMAHAKTNGGIKTPSLGFWIHADGRFEWGDESDVDADELVGAEQQHKRKESQLDKAKDFLLGTLKEGPVRQTELAEKAKAIGLHGSLWRAKEEMGIRSIKEKVGWLWSLS